jgi:putative two-component system response regulator
MITPENQAKLLDFGLVHHLRSNVTAPKLTLGTIEFMAPEQVSNASGVDVRSDIYALGGTLYWCLTGERPFISEGGFGEALLRRLTLPAPSVRSIRPDVPAELDAVVARMMAHDPGDRYATPAAVSRALAPFLRADIRQQLIGPARPAPGDGSSDDATRSQPGSRARRILTVDDDRTIRDLCCHILKADGLQCEQAEDGLDALNKVRAEPFDLLLVDVEMPQLDGATLCRLLRDDPPCPNLKIVMVSGQASSDEMAKMLLAGADDYITKPFSLTQLRARVQSELRLKDAQDRADRLNRELFVANQQLHEAAGNRADEQVRARDALVLALAQCVEFRDGETAQHLLRLQRYSRCLAQEAAKHERFAGQITQDFLDTLHCCVPLHDLGKIRLPDHILLKPDKLTPEERILVEAHTVIGAETLQEVAGQQGASLAFLQMAIDIARHHHERHDGTGYPDGLAGATIPLAARLTSVADVYDALRSRRVYKPALSHDAAMRLIVAGSSSQFDPALVEALQRCGDQFNRIFSELPD